MQNESDDGDTMPPVVACGLADDPASCMIPVVVHMPQCVGVT